LPTFKKFNLDFLIKTIIFANFLHFAKAAFSRNWSEFYLLLLFFLGSARVEGGGPPALIPEALLRDDGEEPVKSSCKIMPKNLQIFTNQQAIKERKNVTKAAEKCAT